MKLTLFALLMASAFGQEKPLVTPGPPIDSYRISPPQSFAMNFEGREILRIAKDGTITFGPGVTPSEAAKEFAKYLKQYMGDLCVSIPAKEKQP